jgi:UDP-N-acetylmuramyl pentapeptide phosphotransferase/UDP-N-acetylglucosamine-1-phosphate transferase
LATSAPGAKGFGVSTELSFAGRDLEADLGDWLWCVRAVVDIVASNVTDGLGGLASGSSAVVAAGVVFVAFWQVRHEVAVALGAGIATGAGTL